MLQHHGFVPETQTILILFPVRLGLHFLYQEEHNRALVWLKRAAEMGEMQAVFQLSIMHYDGIGTLPNLVSRQVAVFNTLVLSLIRVQHSSV